MYTFTLKKITFHDGTVLTANIIKKNIEFFIKNRFLKYQIFRSIVGAVEFEEGQTPNISGIHLDKNSPLTFSIELNQPTPDLLNEFTDFRLSILKPDRNYMIGLGSYRIGSVGSDKVELIAYGPNPAMGEEKRPEKVSYYENISKETAIDGFKKGIFDDLIFYSLTQRDRDGLIPYAQFKFIYFPRTLLFVLNARKIKRKEERLKIIFAIDWNKLHQSCYADRTRAYSIMAQGMLGYKRFPDKNMQKYFDRLYSNKQITLPVKDHLTNLAVYKFAILKNLDNESCLQKFFTEKSVNAIESQISDLPLNKMLEEWQANQLDGMFLSLEGSTNTSFLSFFDPATHNLFGDPSDTHYVTKYLAANKENDPVLKERLASELDDYILNMGTVVPFVYPPVYIVYSKRFKPLKSVLREIYRIPFSEFHIRKSADENSNK